LRSLDILEFQSREIERAGLQLSEDNRLQDERRLLVNAERLASASAYCYDLLYENESATLAQLATVAKKLEELAHLDGRFGPYLESVETAKYSLEDLAYFLRDYVDNINFSAERLKEIEDRLIEIDRLKRKYGGSGGSIEEILAAAARMREELIRIKFSDAREQQLTGAIAEARATYWRAAEQLSQRRRVAASKLETAVKAELQQLAMEQTQFNVSFFGDSIAEARAFERGIDTVELLVSPNIGEELRPLAKIASGGEISRLMLALKTITAPTEYPRTLVFDEVDVGIGGRVAESVGQRLKRLAASNQVLCVTHQAQIARFADLHFSVEKRVVGERTEVIIDKLNRKGRVEELARMIGGAEITELTRRHAHEMLGERK
jgi:DNA repair protein RecN (Recombination protein N)